MNNSFVEISFKSKPDLLVQQFAEQGINLEAFVLNRDFSDYRFVIKKGDIDLAKSILNNQGVVGCFSPVLLVPQRAVPGELQRYLSPDVRMAYMAENNRLVFRG